MISNKSGSNKNKPLLILLIYVTLFVELCLINFISSSLGITKEQPILFFISFLVVGFTAIFFFWLLGGVLKKRFATLGKIFQYWPIVLYSIGVILTFINMFIPFLSSY